MTTEQTLGARKVLDTALLIAATTALAYAVAYAYESAYCSHFGVPKYLISPTPAVLVGSVVGVFFTALNVMPLLAMFRLFLHKRGVTELARFRIEISLFFVFVIFTIGGLAWVSALLTLAFTFIFLGEYVSVFWLKGTLNERLLAIEKVPDPIAEHNPITRLLKSVNDRRVSQFVLVSWLAYIGAMAVGAFTARTQTDFDVVLSRPDVVLLKAYGDYFIGVKFDQTSKKAMGEVLVFKIADDFKELHLIKKRIGPLAKAND
jgi:hypothetical protein